MLKSIGIIPFYLLRKTYPEYKLKIYGNNEDDSIIVKQINSLKLQNYVEIIKGQTNVFDKELNAAMFVLPSLEEGMPNVLMEAMAHQIPSIATDCEIGGPGELIGQDKGILVPIKDSQAIYHGMLKFIENPVFAESCAKKSFEEIQKYDPNIIKIKWLKLIEDTLNE